MLRRVIVLLSVAVLGAAAPARAWCEASCLAPVDATSTPHCPTHDHSGGIARLSGSAIPECPVIDSARPAALARLDLVALTIATALPHVDRPPVFTASFSLPRSTRTVFERCTPLRI